jgi:hypothetical protein
MTRAEGLSRHIERRCQERAAGDPDFTFTFETTTVAIGHSRTSIKRHGKELVLWVLPKQHFQIRSEARDIAAGGTFEWQGPATNEHVPPRPQRRPLAEVTIHDVDTLMNLL